MRKIFEKYIAETLYEFYRGFDFKQVAELSKSHKDSVIIIFATAKEFLDQLLDKINSPNVIMYQIFESQSDEELVKIFEKKFTNSYF